MSSHATAAECDASRSITPVDHPFPYDLVTTVIQSELVVIAVAHHSREPDYWISRMKKLSR